MELARVGAGRSVDELAKGLRVSAATILRWKKHDKIDDGDSAPVQFELVARFAHQVLRVAHRRRVGFLPGQQRQFVLTAHDSAAIIRGCEHESRNVRSCSTFSPMLSVWTIGWKLILTASFKVWSSTTVTS